jgi:hypothetical protein
MADGRTIFGRDCDRAARHQDTRRNWWLEQATQMIRRAIACAMDARDRAARRLLQLQMRSRVSLVAAQSCQRKGKSVATCGRGLDLHHAFARDGPQRRALPCPPSRNATDRMGTRAVAVDCAFSTSGGRTSVAFGSALSLKRQQIAKQLLDIHRLRDLHRRNPDWRDPRRHQK